MQKHVNLVDLVESFQRVFPCKIWLRAAENEPLGIWNFDENWGIWTGENSFSISQITVGIGNLNCGASEHASVLRPVVQGVREGCHDHTHGEKLERPMGFLTVFLLLKTVGKI